MTPISLAGLGNRARREINRSNKEQDMSKQTLEQLLVERVAAFAESGKPAEIIDEHVQVMFTKVIDNCFGRYGELGKQVEEAVKAALPANLGTVFELTRYNAMIAKALQERWENSGLEADVVRRAQESINEILVKDQMPEFISLTELMEEFVDRHKESAAENHWERPDIRFKESDYGGLHIYFDKEQAERFGREDSEYSLENAIHISFDRRNPERDDKGNKVGTVYAAKLEGEKIGQKIRLYSKFDKLIAALYYGASKIVVDCDEDDFSYGIYD